eukprot:g10848.t1
MGLCVRLHCVNTSLRLLKAQSAETVPRTPHSHSKRSMGGSARGPAVPGLDLSGSRKRIKLLLLFWAQFRQQIPKSRTTDKEVEKEEESIQGMPSLRLRSLGGNNTSSDIPKIPTPERSTREKTSSEAEASSSSPRSLGLELAAPRGSASLVEDEIAFEEFPDSGLGVATNPDQEPSAKPSTPSQASEQPFLKSLTSLKLMQSPRISAAYASSPRQGLSRTMTRKLCWGQAVSLVDAESSKLTLCIVSMSSWQKWHGPLQRSFPSHNRHAQPENSQQAIATCTIGYR